MKYTEELLKQVQAMHKIPDATARIWKLRGSIPDKYFTGVDLTKADSDDLSFILSFKESSILNWASFAAGSQKIADFFRGKSTLSSKEAAEIKKTILKLRGQLEIIENAQNFSKKALLISLLESKNLHKYACGEYNLIQRLLLGKDAIPQEIAEVVAKIKKELY